MGIVKLSFSGGRLRKDAEPDKGRGQGSGFAHVKVFQPMTARSSSPRSIR
jgi:hypothetical protein